ATALLSWLTLAHRAGPGPGPNQECAAAAPWPRQRCGAARPTGRRHHGRLHLTFIGTSFPRRGTSHAQPRPGDPGSGAGDPEPGSGDPEPGPGDSEYRPGVPEPGPGDPEYRPGVPERRPGVLVLAAVKVQGKGMCPYRQPPSVVIARQRPR